MTERALQRKIAATSLWCYRCGNRAFKRGAARSPAYDKNFLPPLCKMEKQHLPKASVGECFALWLQGFDEAEASTEKFGHC